MSLFGLKYQCFTLFSKKCEKNFENAHFNENAIDLFYISAIMKLLKACA